ncbi:MAG: polysaccharide deacetylase family protein [Chloroflexi bacterium]|nr:polysaccharide deacetylase family protein [Chloroflexota bacterium]
MQPNPLLKKLGYSSTDRLVIIHTDDIGMCHASTTAFEHLWEFGTISSGAVMTPCPWFPAAAEMCRKNPQMDMGVHATFNSEWETMRWSPVSTRDPESGLIDRDGYFHQWQDAVYENAKEEAVAAELNAQVERALAAGIDVTHIDSHMGTIMNSKFVQSYLQAGMSRLLPNMLPRASAQGFAMMGVDEEALAAYTPILAQLEAQGAPMLDGLFSMPLEHDNDHIGIAKKLLSEAPAGITHFILHPSADTPELRAICPDWRARVANYNAFMNNELKQFIKDSGIQLIGYHAIRDAMRKA